MKFMGIANKTLRLKRIPVTFEKWASSSFPWWDNDPVRMAEAKAAWDAGQTELRIQLRERVERVIDVLTEQDDYTVKADQIAIDDHD